jgi:hypothetical protein
MWIIRCLEQALDRQDFLMIEVRHLAGKGEDLRDFHIGISKRVTLMK